MPCVAEFGIIEEFDKDKDYSSEYEPQKYNCVAIDDDILNDWWEDKHETFGNKDNRNR